MVKSVSIGKFKSSKKDSCYTCLVFDLGYRTVKVFTEPQNLMAISGLSSEDYYNLKEDDFITLIGK